MAKKNKPDKLAQEAAQALAARMSYGKWKAMQTPVIIAKPAIPDGLKACERCGRIFKAVGIKRFCDDECRRQAYDERRRERKGGNV